MKKLISILVVISLVLAVLAGCAPSAAPQPTGQAKPAETASPTAAPAETQTAQPQAAGEIVIGCIQDLSAGTSVWGNAVNNGAKLAVKLINEKGGVNGQQLKLVSYDVKTDPQEAIAAYTRLVDQDKAVAVIGPPISNIGLSLTKLTAEKKVPAIGSWIDPRVMVNEDGSLNPYMFLMQPSSRQGAEILADYALNVLSLKKFALFYDQTNAFAVANIKPFKEYVEKNGGEIVTEQVYKKGDKDFKTQLNKIKNAGGDAMYMPNYVQDCVLTVGQAQQVGLQTVMLGGLDFAPPFNTLLADPSIANNIYFANNYSDTDPQLQEVKAAYQKEFNTDPLNKSYLGYDQILLIVQAIQNGGNADGESIMKGLEQVKDLQGTTGVITISKENHMPVGLSMVILKIEAGKYVDLGRHVPESHK